METLVEQRIDTRTEISWPVSIWLPKANRFFNGKSDNISKSGVYVKLPMTTPIREGDAVEINFPRTTALAEEKGQFGRLKKGSVIRIERKSMLQDAKIGVAVQFIQ
ncbi:MAG: hypothetical protein JW804_06605 [Sedimentisphaerales bacterium]|nr:hypothetical protein [Sedimentisphaerales bacterium]